jgi:three-Cys-motif partner protein
MTAPRTTVWDLESHTRAKHEILKRYLDAWIPILALGGFPEIIYMDGFAGPGRYSKGEDGSPIIALRAALAHQEHIKARVQFLFVEKDAARAAVLQEVVNGIPRPANFRAKVAGGETLEAAFCSLLRSYTDRAKRLPPTFAFIDPFGWAGVPFTVVQQLLTYPSCEVLVTFMYEEIHRFISLPEQAANFDALFGTRDWRGALPLTDKERRRFLHDLYVNQLHQQAKVRYVRSFEMRNDRDVTDYYLFYGTNSLLGLQKMKAAMWKVNESGEFTFRDATDPNQMVLFAKQPRIEALRTQLLERFKGLEATVGGVEEFVLADTAFRETHFKVQILKSLESADPPGLVVTYAPAGRRAGTYADRSIRIRFS